MTILLFILNAAVSLPPAPITAPRPAVRWIHENERRQFWRGRRP